MKLYTGSYDKGEDFDRLDALIATAETESSSRSGTPIGTRSPDSKSGGTSARDVSDRIMMTDAQKHGNRLFYLALPPTAFESCSSMLSIVSIYSKLTLLRHDP